MSEYTEKDIQNLLENWHDTKKNITELEKKFDKYKKLAEKIMSSQNCSKLESKYYSLSKRKLTRQQLSRQNIPKDIWDKYSHEITYPVFYIKKKK